MDSSGSVLPTVHWYCLWCGKSRPDSSMLTGLPFIWITPSGAFACMSKQEHALSPEGQRLPQPVGGPSIRDCSCHAPGGGPRYGMCLGGRRFPSKPRWRMRPGTEPRVLLERKTWVVSRLPKTCPYSLTASRVWALQSDPQGPENLARPASTPGSRASHTNTASSVSISCCPRTCLFLSLQASVSMST